MQGELESSGAETMLGRCMSGLSVLAISLALLTAVRAPHSQAAGPGYYVADSLAVVAPEAPFPAGGAGTIALASAGNEYEGAHVVLHGGSGGLRGVDLRLAGPLTANSGAAIPEETVAFYREHYVAVTSASGLRGKPGHYPDALIPLRDPFTGRGLGTRSYPAAPFDVAPEKNQPVYVEFFIPRGTAAGLYRGAIRIEQDGAGIFAEVPVTLQVWNFELPARPALRTNFQGYDSGYASGAARYLGYAAGSAEHRALARAVDEMLIAHRLTPESPLDTLLEMSQDGTVRGETPPAGRLLSYLKRPEYSDYLLPFGIRYPFPSPTTQNRLRSLNYLRSAYAWFQSHGVESKVFLRPGDEPARTADFRTIRELAELAREASPEYRVAMTVDIKDPRVSGFFSGVVERLVAGYWSFDPEVAASHRANGHEIWSYTALVQNAGEPSPYWLIDFPLLNYRIASWINFRYGITGLLYWTSAYWDEAAAREESPWVTPCNYKNGTICYNGEGLLVYPGREVSLVVPAGAYGEDSRVPVYGPIASLRLKALRDAVEDYEYLAMASAADAPATGRILLDVACAGNAVANCFHHWNRDPGALLGARDDLARLIESSVLQQRGQTQPGDRRDGTGRPGVGRGR
jgi:hypothetical protein